MVDDFDGPHVTVLLLAFVLAIIICYSKQSSHGNRNAVIHSVNTISIRVDLF